MKKLIVVMVLAAMCGTVLAQPADSGARTVAKKNMALELTAGYTVPMGSYASEDHGNDRSGYATGGWQLQAGFYWMGAKNLGMAFQYTFQRNPMEHAANKVYPPPAGIPDSLGTKAWSNHYLLVGPVFMRTAGKLYLEAKLLGGVLISSSALFDTRDPADTTGQKINTNMAAGFACQLSAGVGYNVSPHFTFKLNVTFMGAWPVMSRQYGSQYLGMKKYIDPVTGLPEYEPIYSAPIEYEIKKTVTTLSPSLGFVYRF